MHLITLNAWSDTDVLETVENSLKIKNHPEKYRHAVGGRASVCFSKRPPRERAVPVKSV